MKQLDDSQLETFDTEYMTERRWQIIQELIDKDFPQGNFSFLDVGGGNGKFVDGLLMRYPQSQGTVLDNSELLLGKNKPNDRKTLVCDSVENINNLNQKYDLVCFNYLLHHLVVDSYSESRKNIILALNNVIPLLKDGGRISIFENMYNGLFYDGLPSHIIFRLTSFKPLATFTKKMGANTAGVGVCFLSKNQWDDTIKNTNLLPLKYTDDQKNLKIKMAWKIFLHVSDIRTGHFWLANKNH